MSLLKSFMIISAALAVTFCEAGIEARAETLVAGERPEDAPPPSAATAEPNTLKETPLRLSFELVDGSRVIGIPAIKSFPVQTAYASMDIPLEQIVSVAIKGDDVVLEMRNGDKMTGVLNIKPLVLKTIFGEVSVDLQHVRSVHICESTSTL